MRAATIIASSVSLYLLISLAELGADASPVASPVTEFEIAVPLHIDAARPTTITGGTVEQVQIVRAGLERFSALQLELPPLDIEITSGGSGCGGNMGLFIAGPDSARIELCHVDRWVVLHELGHAWTKENLSDEDRDQLLKAWGLVSWNDSETPWRRRGTESAADAIAWGLIEDPVGCHSPSGPIAERVEAFRLVTGIDTPRVRCEPGAARGSVPPLLQHESGFATVLNPTGRSPVRQGDPGLSSLRQRTARW